MTQLVVRNEMDVMKLGDLLFRSGYFQDAKSAGQAVVKVLAGQELGLGPIASMTGIHIIKGQVSPGASIIAAVVKRSQRYNYQVRELTPQKCDIVFYENGKSIGSSSFTADDARKAGTTNMGKYPRNMLFARAMSNGAKWYTPDLFGGPIYEPGELGADVDYETDNVINGPDWEVVTEIDPTVDEPEAAVEANPEPEPTEEAPIGDGAPEFPAIYKYFAEEAVKKLGYKNTGAVTAALAAAGIKSIVNMQDQTCAFNQADAWAILQDAKA